uniref:Uncharacterized protein n=1 Tax=Acrobeloides nanus TaxID=290746 RepID=A0A914CS18_9BILA
MKRLLIVVFILTLSFAFICCISKEDDGSGQNESASSEESTDPKEKEYYKFLIRRLKQNANAVKSPAKNVLAAPYAIPGPFEPLPGRSYNGDYWPLFPFQNQYSGGLDLDPSLSRHIGGDFNIPIPSWGIMDVRGHFNNRVADTTTKFGYISHPVNMLGLDKKDFVRLISDPALNSNRNIQPTVPLGKVPKSFVPISCKPPLCNPYTGNFMFGVEHDFGGSDGVNGDIDIPFPIAKGVAYRYPFGGNIYYHLDNLTVSYGHNVGPLDPYTNPYMFANKDYIRNTDKILADSYAFANPATYPRTYPPRQKRDIPNLIAVPYLAIQPNLNQQISKIRFHRE